MRENGWSEENDLEGPYISTSLVADLLGLTGVTTVIVVDDEFDPNVDAALALGGAVTGMQLTVSGLGKIDFSLERELWEDDLRSRWRSLTILQRRQAISDLSHRAGVPLLRSELGQLAELMTSVTLMLMAPEEWKSEKNRVLEAATDPMLVLFDKHLGADRLEDGIDLIKDLQVSAKNTPIWTGLLTNRVGPDDEHQAWDDVSIRLGENASRVIVLAKERLSNDVESFVEGLRVLLMAEPAAMLQRVVATACREVGDEVLEDMQRRLNPREFERVVFGLARDEGIWEVDVILRLLDVRRKAKVRSELHSDERVRDSVILLRRLDMLRSPGTSSSSVQAQRIYQREVYEEGDHLSRLQLPIELGDVFIKEHSNKHFILVGQPCDLMVRNTGKRHPEVSFVTLLPIIGEDLNQVPLGSQGARAVFELPAFWPGGEPGWVELDRSAIVPIEAVDYCVMSDDGRSVAPIGSELGDWLIPGWQKRRERLTRQADLIRERYEGLSTQCKRFHISSALGIRKDCLTKPSIDGDNFDLGLRRVRRVRAPYARSLLTSFCLHLARDAFERPLPANDEGMGTS